MLSASQRIWPFTFARASCSANHAGLSRASRAWLTQAVAQAGDGYKQAR